MIFKPSFPYLCFFIKKVTLSPDLIGFVDTADVGSVLSHDLSLEVLKLRAFRTSLEKLLYRFLLESTGGFVKRGESTGIGVFGTGDEGGEEDIGDSDEEAHDEGKNDEVTDNGDNGVDEHVESESFLFLW